jgi:hypothetical protein
MELISTPPMAQCLVTMTCLYFIAVIRLYCNSVLCHDLVWIGEDDVELQFIFAWNTVLGTEKYFCSPLTPVRGTEVLKTLNVCCHDSNFEFVLRVPYKPVAVLAYERKHSSFFHHEFWRPFSSRLMVSLYSRLPAAGFMPVCGALMKPARVFFLNIYFLLLPYLDAASVMCLVFKSVSRRSQFISWSWYAGVAMRWYIDVALSHHTCRPNIPALILRSVIWSEIFV